RRVDVRYPAIKYPGPLTNVRFRYIVPSVVHLEVCSWRVIRRVRPVERQPEEEGLRRVAAHDEVRALARHPVCRMEMFGQVSRSGHPTVPAYAVVSGAKCTLFMSFKPQMVIAYKIPLSAVGFVKHHMVKSIQFSRGRMVHLAHRLCM